MSQNYAVSKYLDHDLLVQSNILWKFQFPSYNPRGLRVFQRLWRMTDSNKQTCRYLGMWGTLYQIQTYLFPFSSTMCCPYPQHTNTSHQACVANIWQWLSILVVSCPPSSLHCAATMFVLCKDNGAYFWHKSSPQIQYWHMQHSMSFPIHNRWLAMSILVMYCPYPPQNNVLLLHCVTIFSVFCRDSLAEF